MAEAQSSFSRDRPMGRPTAPAEGPNRVWHIDGNHKLIKWRLVVHGGVDGYSRVITYLCCNTNNRAETVCNAFHSAVVNYGLPKKVMSDLGGENIQVWAMMIEEHGGPKCVVSSSIHARIMRLWRDVHHSVTVVYANLFRELEAEGDLDHLNETDIYCLHYVFVPRINESLKSFSGAWNNHSLSTEHNQTPYQLFIKGLIDNNSDSDSDSDSGAEVPQPVGNEAVTVPQCSFMPCESLKHELITRIHPLRSCNQHGRSWYLLACDLCGNHLTRGCDECAC